MPVMLLLALARNQYAGNSGPRRAGNAALEAEEMRAPLRVTSNDQAAIVARGSGSHR